VTTTGGAAPVASRALEYRHTRAARQGAYRLRARARRITSSRRERGCGILPVHDATEHPWIQVHEERGKRGARWHGLMACGHIWTCPVCSSAKRAKRVELLSAAVRGLQGRWQMLTITLRHRPGMSLKTLLHGMMAAWRKARQGGMVQRVWSERVSASARATEITHGENGWHPHLHVLLRTSAWEPHEHAALLERWQNAIRASLGEACEPNDLRALWWSEPFEGGASKGLERYIGKLALEVGGFGKDRSHWSVLERASSGDVAAWRLWSEFFDATRGRRAFELDDRCADAGRRQLADEAEPDVRDMPEGVEPHRVSVPRDTVRLMRIRERDSPGIFALALEIVERGGSLPELARAIEDVRRPLASGNTGPPHQAEVA
jgi:hypothetical protein